MLTEMLQISRVMRAWRRHEEKAADMTRNDSNLTATRNFFAQLNAGAIAEAVQIFASEGTWWMAGNDGHGVHKTMPEVAEHFRRALEGAGKGVRFTECAMYSDDDTVVAAMRGNGVLVNGKEYHNNYLFVLNFRDGVICGGREYFDTEHATRLFS